MLQKVKFWQDGWCGGVIFRVCTLSLKYNLTLPAFMVYLSPTMEMGWVELRHVKYKMLLFSLVGRLAAE
jgi:hypothetical protein